MAEFKPQYNYKPLDLNKFMGGNDFGFPVNGKPGYNGDIFPKYVGALSEKNYTDMIQNDEIRNKNADYIIGGRLYDAVVDVNGRGDFLSIQEALNSGKKRIFVRNGEYAPITITSNEVTISGESQNAIIKPKESTGYDEPLIYIDSSDNVIIENIQLLGNYDTDPTATQDGIRYNGNCNGGRIAGCKITKNSQYGIILPGGFIDDPDGEIVDEQFYIEIVGNTLEESGAIGAYITGYQHIITNNTFKVGMTGSLLLLELSGVCSNNILSCSVWSDYCVKIQDCSALVFSSNYTFSGKNNILLTGTSASLITNNMIDRSLEDIVKIVDSQENKITGNYIRSFGSFDNDTYSGIILLGSSTYSTYNIISNNTIVNQTIPSSPKLKYSIKENDSNQNYNVITGNITKDSATANILVQGANTIKANNIE